MATFISHPLFGAGASYILYRSSSKADSTRFIMLSTLCQWLPDIDTLAYLFPVAEQHPLGHRGLTHSAVFALALAFAVMTIFYRTSVLSRLQWWKYYGWFFLMTLSHGIFDALVNGTLGVAFFWPFAPRRYLFIWQPLMDIPIQFSELFRLSFWHAQWIECQFFSFLLASFYVAHRLYQSYCHRPRALPSISRPMVGLTSKP